MSQLRFEQNVGIEGFVFLEVENPDGSTARSLGPFKNVILDQGFTEMETRVISDNWRDGIAIGVGDTAPATTDTSLENQKASTTTILENTRSISADGSDPFIVTFEAQYEFAKGDLDSSVDGTYKELGLRSVTPTLVTRTLIKDSTGAATSISVASDQKLRVWYKISLTVTPSTPTAASFDITNIGTINYTHQPLNSAAFFGPAGSGNLYPFEPIAHNSGVTDCFARLLTVDRTQSQTWTTIGATWDEFGGTITNNFGNNNLGDNSTSQVSPGVWDTDLFWGTSQGNGSQIDGIRLDLYDNNGYYDSTAWAALFDAADAFTKDDLHELTITLRLSYTRP